MGTIVKDRVGDDWKVRDRAKHVRDQEGGIEFMEGSNLVRRR